MNSLLALKEGLKIFYGKYDTYIISVLKFILALMTFMMINIGLGQMDKVNSPFVVLILALFCSFLPPNAIVIFGSGMILLHLYALSLDAFLVGGGFMVVILLLYFGTSPKEVFAFILTPVAFALKIPCAVPLIFGLVRTPISCVSIGLGTIGFFVLQVLGGGRSNEAQVSKDAAEAMLQKITGHMDGILKNPTVLIMVITMIAVMITVYAIRRMMIKYSWGIAIGAGGVMFLIISSMGEIIMGSLNGLITLVIGTAVSMVIAFLVKFICFQVDYRKTEKVQFEDDEYYYYVTAVPKVSAVKKKPVKEKGYRYPDTETVIREQNRSNGRERRDKRSDLDIKNY